MTPEHRPDHYLAFAKCADCGTDCMVRVDYGIRTPDPTRCPNCESIRAANGGPVSWVLVEQIDEATEILGVFSTRAKAERAKADVASHREWTDGLSVRAFATDLIKMKAVA